MSRLLILFETTHAAIKAERLCIGQNIPCKVIAVPREISSGCGIALELKEEQKTAIGDLLSAHSVKFSLHLST
jgi:hypothetical protein